MYCSGIAEKCSGLVLLGWVKHGKGEVIQRAAGEQFSLECFGVCSLGNARPRLGLLGFGVAVFRWFGSVKFWHGAVKFRQQWNSKAKQSKVMAKESDESKRIVRSGMVEAKSCRGCPVVSWLRIAKSRRKRGMVKKRYGIALIRSALVA